MRAALLLMLSVPAWAADVTTMHDGLLDLPADDDAVLPEVPVDADAQIWNGVEVGQTALRGVVSLFVGGRFGGNWQGGSFCSGTLVHPEWVVTAAHCLDSAESQTGGGFNLYVGIGNDFPYDKQVAWDSYVLHPNYNPRAGAGAGYDIGLVKLASPVYDEPLIGVIDEEMDSSWVGVELTFSGFGITRDNGGGGGTKRRTTLPLIHYDGDLLMSFNGSVFFDAGDEAYYVARYNSTSNVCQGDSGGATLAPLNGGGFLLVGVNAIVTPSCVNGAAGSTRVDWYREWIETYVPLADVGGGGSPLGPEFQLDASEAGDLEPLPYGDPLSPIDALAYEQVSDCNHAGGAPAGWLGLVALSVLGWRRRERA